MAVSPSVDPNFEPTHIGIAAEGRIIAGLMSGPPESGVESPCVRNCCLDEHNVCMGCGRLLTEIVGWSRASDEERRTIVAASRKRAAERRAADARTNSLPFRKSRL
jgi:predicted Fe-S protein YdhL (DUF1289 family)